jgi:hypothetical protein
MFNSDDLVKSLKAVKMGRLRKKAAGKARESCGKRRTVSYAAMTQDEAQRSIRTFYDAVHSLSGIPGIGGDLSRFPYTHYHLYLGSAILFRILIFVDRSPGVV